MSETPRKPEDADDATEALPGDDASAGQETADQPTINLKRDEPAEPLLEDEPAEYELPGPAPRPAGPAGEPDRAAQAAEPSGDEPEIKDERPEEDDPGLPTSDPVFPTASPQLRPPVPPTPGDVSGFGTPGGSEDDLAAARATKAPGGSASDLAVTPASGPAVPPAAGLPAAGVPAAPGSPAADAALAAAGSTASTGVARPLPPTGPPRQRSATEIRADIEAGRQELSQSVEVLRDKVEELTDWRGQIRKHRREITVAAAAVGFVVGARFMMKRRRR